MSRVRLPSARSDVANDAERLIEIARTVNVLRRRGMSMNGACALLNYTLEECELALAFHQANHGFKLRALVEDWPLPVIKQACFCEGRSFADCHLSS